MAVGEEEKQVEEKEDFLNNRPLEDGGYNCKKAIQRRQENKNENIHQPNVRWLY